MQPVHRPERDLDVLLRQILDVLHGWQELAGGGGGGIPSLGIRLSNGETILQLGGGNLQSDDRIVLLRFSSSGSGSRQESNLQGGYRYSHSRSTKGFRWPGRIPGSWSQAFQSGWPP